jgi:hypothetical protein
LLEIFCYFTHVSLSIGFASRYPFSCQRVISLDGHIACNLLELAVANEMALPTAKIAPSSKENESRLLIVGDSVKQPTVPRKFASLGL